MKTREEVYAKETAEVLRYISTYHCIKRDQLSRLFENLSTRLDAILSYLIHQGRIFNAGEIYFESAECNADRDMLSAIYVFCDFCESSEYDAVCEFPSKVLFFSNGEVYDVIVVAEGKESLVCCALNSAGDIGKHFVVVESLDQIDRLDIPNVAAYCIVDLDSGDVKYYKPED